MKKIKEEEMEINTAEKIEVWFKKQKGKKCCIKSRIRETQKMQNEKFISNIRHKK